MSSAVKDRPLNIQLISVTFAVSKLDRSRVVKDLQKLNIQLISVTFAVSKLDRSRVVKDLQKLNILFISVTCAVSKLDRSSAVKDSQSENISLISVTCEVLRYSKPSMLLSDWRYVNHPAVVLGRKSRNEASKTTVRTVVLGDTKLAAQAGVPNLSSVSLIPHFVPSRSARRVS